jgi:hypothetical protein
MPYPVVHISNSTGYPATGTVTYPSFVCSDDNYSITPPNQHDWRAGGRGLCLVSRITATLTINGKSVTAAPYESSGTSYSEFAIIQIGENYAVVRIAGAMEADNDQGPIEAEPTEQQK